MLRRRDGFILLEALLSFTIATLIITSLTLTVVAEYKYLDKLETLVSVRKLMWLKIKDPNLPEQTIINGKKYIIHSDKELIKITTEPGDSYEVKW